MAERSWVVGSSPACDILAEGDGVCDKHCRLTQRGDWFLLEDLKSASGTFVDRNRILGPKLVRRGDRVTLGPSAPLPWPPALSSISIGRSPDNDIVIPLDMVSGHHARLERDGDSVYLVDLGSSNGTAINKLLNKIERAKLQVTDAVYFGTHRVSASELFRALPTSSRQPSLQGRQAPNELERELEATLANERHTKKLARTWSVRSWLVGLAASLACALLILGGAHLLIRDQAVAIETVPPPAPAATEDVVKEPEVPSAVPADAEDDDESTLEPPTQPAGLSMPESLVIKFADRILEWINKPDEEFTANGVEGSEHENSGRSGPSTDRASAISASGIGDAPGVTVNDSQSAIKTDLPLANEPSAVAAESIQRKWTDSTGKYSVQASLISIDGDSIVLVSDKGKTKRVPIAVLSEADREWLIRYSYYSKAASQMPTEVIEVLKSAAQKYVLRNKVVEPTKDIATLLDFARRENPARALATLLVCQEAVWMRRNKASRGFADSVREVVSASRREVVAASIKELKPLEARAIDEGLTAAEDFLSVVDNVNPAVQQMIETDKQRYQEDYAWWLLGTQIAEETRSLIRPITPLQPTPGEMLALSSTHHKSKNLIYEGFAVKNLEQVAMPWVVAMVNLDCESNTSAEAITSTRVGQRMIDQLTGGNAPDYVGRDAAASKVREVDKTLLFVVEDLQPKETVKLLILNSNTYSETVAGVTVELYWPEHHVVQTIDLSKKMRAQERANAAAARRREREAKRIAQQQENSSIFPSAEPRRLTAQ